MIKAWPGSPLPGLRFTMTLNHRATGFCVKRNGGGTTRAAGTGFHAAKASSECAVRRLRIDDWPRLRRITWHRIGQATPPYPAQARVVLWIAPLPLRFWQEPQGQVWRAKPFAWSCDSLSKSRFERQTLARRRSRYRGCNASGGNNGWRRMTFWAKAGPCTVARAVAR